MKNESKFELLLSCWHVLLGLIQLFLLCDFLKILKFLDMIYHFLKSFIGGVKTNYFELYKLVVLGPKTGGVGISSTYLLNNLFIRLLDSIFTEVTSTH